MGDELNTDRTFLGVVQERWQAGASVNANLLPLWEADATGTIWKHELSAEERNSFFPNRGIALWFDCPLQAVHDSLWCFRSFDQRGVDPSRDFKNWINANEVVPAREAIDLKELGGLDKGISQIQASGLERSAPPPRDVYLLVDDNWWAGPIEFTRSSASNRWVLAASYQTTPCPCRHWPEGKDMIKIGIDDVPSRFVLPPNAVLPPPTERIDLGLDADVFKRVLRLLRERDKAFAESIGLTASAIDRLAENLIPDTPTTVTSQFLQWRFDRVKSMLEQATGQFQLAETARQYLEEGPLKVELESQRAAVFKKTRADALAAVAAEVTAQELHLKEIRDQINREQKLAEEVRSSMESVRNDQHLLLGRFEESLSKRIETLRRRPEDFFAETVLLRAALQSSTSTRPPLAASPAIKSIDPPKMTDHAALTTLLGLALESRDTPKALSIPLHSAFLGGAMPLLAGGRAFQALAAYAATVAGGRCLWIPVSPTALTPADLLGRVENGRFVPNSGGLADLLLQAESDEGLFLVVLDGLNLSACESYLLPLLACCSEAHQVDGRTLSLFVAQAVAPDDPYAKLADLRWPQNVLMSGTLVDGTATVGMPAAMWGQACLMLTDQFPVGDGSSAVPLPHTAVPISAWKKWQDEARGRDAKPCVRLWDELTRGEVGRSHRDLCLRLFRGARSVATEAEALGCVTAFGLAPALVRRSDAATRLVARPCIYPDFAAALRELGRILG